MRPRSDKPREWRQTVRLEAKEATKIALQFGSKRDISYGMASYHVWINDRQTRREQTVDICRAIFEHSANKIAESGRVKFFKGTEEKPIRMPIPKSFGLYDLRLVFEADERPPPPPPVALVATTTVPVVATATAAATATAQAEADQASEPPASTEDADGDSEDDDGANDGDEYMAGLLRKNQRRQDRAIAAKVAEEAAAAAAAAKPAKEAAAADAKAPEAASVSSAQDPDYLFPATCFGCKKEFENRRDPTCGVCNKWHCIHGSTPGCQPCSTEQKQKPVSAAEPLRQRILKAEKARLQLLMRDCWKQPQSGPKKTVLGPVELASKASDAIRRLGRAAKDGSFKSRFLAQLDPENPKKWVSMSTAAPVLYRIIGEKGHIDAPACAKTLLQCYGLEGDAIATPIFQELVLFATFLFEDIFKALTVAAASEIVQTSGRWLRVNNTTFEPDAELKKLGLERLKDRSASILLQTMLICKICSGLKRKRGDDDAAPKPKRAKTK